MKYQAGTFVEVIARKHGHGLHIGSKVQITSAHGHYYLISDDKYGKGVQWALDDTEVVALDKELEGAIIASQSVEKEETPVAKVKTPRVKPIYVVEFDNGDVIHRTGDREFARELKREYGGKAGGVRIMQYVPSKEIR